jgi:glutamate carboxypeptidase
MDSGLADRILRHVRGQAESFIDLTRRLVEAESPSSLPEAQREARHILMAALGGLGLEVLELGAPGIPRHVYAHLPARRRGAPIQLILGHYDTVWPLGTVTERPFRVDGNVLEGPGVFDMKGGLAQLVIALGALRDLGLQPTLTPVIFVNADEETGSRSSTRFIRRLARHANRALVLEPALGRRGRIKIARKGIGRFTVTVFGKAAHAGLDPEDGASAILELAHVIQALFAMNDPERGITVNVGTVYGGVQPNVIAPHGGAVIDVRVPTLADGAAIEARIHAIRPRVAGVRLHIEGSIGRPSMEPTARNEALWNQAQQLGELLGLELEGAKVGGGSDGNTTSQFTATLDGLGPVGRGAHAEHECLYVDRTLERAALLARLLMSPAVPQAAAGGDP